MSLSLLELLLPAGRAEVTVVLGSGCPPRLRPVTDPADAGGPVDLAVIAPTKSECEQADWLANAATTCAARLAPDGVAYALVPRRWRSRARARLKAAGLEIDPAILHLPDAEESRQLVPLEPAPADHALTSVVPVVPWKRTAIRAVLWLRGRDVLVSGLESVALVARREGARPLFDWLPVPGVPAGTPRAVVVSAAWRADGASVVLHPFAAGASPPIVAKLALDSGGEPASEESRLARLAPAATHAGAVVPAPLAGTRLDGAAVLIETRVEGRILAPLLGRRPARLEPALTRLCAWLEAWQRLTATPARLTPHQLEREVLAPGRLLAPHLDGGEVYLARLKNRCAAAADSEAPLTASHNDLTMWNVLLDQRGRLGIVDWEVAEEASLPLKDFFYAVVDAVAATRRYADRPGAADDCFEPGGRHADGVRALQASLAGAVGAAPEILGLSYHACWLGHAANEFRDVGASGPAPFREIVQRLARRDAAGGP